MSIQNITVTTQIIAAGAIDGVLGTAAFLRALHLCQKDIQQVGVNFAQAHTAGKVKIEGWKENQVVVLIDLAVNNSNPQTTVDFVKRITSSGHQILAIADEHDRQDWEKVAETSKQNAQDGEKYLDISNLVIPPQSRSDKVHTSASAMLKLFFGDKVDQHTIDLLDGGEEACNSLQPLTNKFAIIANEATKSNIMDDTRRVYLAKHFALNKEPDEKIVGWQVEYSTMEANKPLILATKKHRGKGIYRYDGNSVGLHDATAIFSAAYAQGDKIVVLHSMRDGKPVVTIARNDRVDEVKTFDIKAILEENKVPHLGGMAARMNIDPEHEAHAVDIIYLTL